MNNLPADIMADLQRGPVLGIDVTRDVAFTTAGEEEKKAPFLRRLLGLPAQAPDIVSLLYRAATISSDAQTLKARAHAALVIHPPLADVPLSRGFSAASAMCLPPAGCGFGLMTPRRLVMLMRA